VAGGRVVRIWHPDVANSVRWRSHQLVFNATPLVEVASEFNRYNETQLHVEGPIRDRQISGVFSTDHPQSLVLFLQRDPSLLVSREDSGWRVLARSVP
jgi:ferric-dicitrate binding protein FerR (iron transport regulator)